MQAMPKHTMERIEAYGQTAVPDILFMLMKEIFPNEDNLRLAMSEEVNRLPFDKSTISFYKASLILEDWIQKVEVAQKYKAHIEPQKMLVIVTKITEAVRNTDGGQDQFFGYEFHQALKELGVRDCPTYSNMELLSKQVLGSMRNRLREISTSRVALRTTLSSKDRIDHLLLLPMLKIVVNYQR
eukprot:648827-Amphidinium_carterae.1